MRGRDWLLSAEASIPELGKPCLTYRASTSAKLSLPAEAQRGWLTCTHRRAGAMDGLRSPRCCPTLLPLVLSSWARHLGSPQL